MPAPHVVVPRDEIDLGSWEFWAQPDQYRNAAFATLRREAPVAFFRELEVPTFPVGPGFWAVARYDDVLQASRNPTVFSSSPSIVIADMLPEVAEFFGSMIVLDDPRHARLRSIVQKGFTPRMVARVDDAVQERARRIVERMVDRHPEGECDFVAEVAAPLPLQIICAMMGIPEDDEEQVFGWTNVILGVGDEDFGADQGAYERVAREIAAFAIGLAEDRRSHPRDDLTTALVQAEVDGDQLTSIEIASFFILLATAGNETTRNAISHGLLELTRHPDERARWWADFDGHARTAVEEIVRWASPVIYMRRTATVDHEVRGATIKAGDKVALFYNSANRDEDHFADPDRFDLGRAPNHHLGFGAGGPHFCLGAHLARREITVAFRELHRQAPDIRASGEPAMLLSPFIHGIKRLPLHLDAPHPPVRPDLIRAPAYGVGLRTETTASPTGGAPAELGEVSPRAVRRRRQPRAVAVTGTWIQPASWLDRRRTGSPATFVRTVLAEGPRADGLSEKGIRTFVPLMTDALAGVDPDYARDVLMILNTLTHSVMISSTVGYLPEGMAYSLMERTIRRLAQHPAMAAHRPSSWVYAPPAGRRRRAP